MVHFVYIVNMKSIILLVAGAALPSIIIIILLLRADKARPEPIGLIGRSVFYGFLASIPAVIIELFLDSFLGLYPGLLGIALKSFIIAALVEEGLKYFFLNRYLYYNPAFNEVMDGIVYAACVSLGFAFAENLLYGMDGGWVLLMRAFTAVPMHAAATGIMGFWLGLSKTMQEPVQANAAKRKGFYYALVIHGAYDFFLFMGSTFALGALVVLFLATRSLRALVKRAKAIDDRNFAIRDALNSL